MGWQAITVAKATGDQLAAQLLDVANDPGTWSLDHFGAMVIRPAHDDGESFYFSPHVAALFWQMLSTHRGAPCNPPLTKQLVPSRTSRILLGFKTRWEPFAPPRPSIAGATGASSKPQQ